MKISLEQSLSPAVPDKGSRLGEESLDSQKMRLRKATREFESFFLLHMLRAMRKTIPENGLLDGGLGQDMYTSMFDEELARTIAGTSRGSLSEILYASLEKHLEARDTGAKTEETPAETGLGGNDRLRSPETDGTDPGPSASHRLPRFRVSADPVLRDYGPAIVRAARAHKVDPRLVYSVIMTESGGRADAVSTRGAKGLMQLVDSTAAEMGVRDSLDPHQNIEGGTKYLRQLLDRFGGNLRLALAAYNAGPGTVSKYNGVPPFRETEQYVEKVLAGLHSDLKP